MDTAATTDDTFHTVTDLQCATEGTSSLAIDYLMGAEGERTPELAARPTVDVDGFDRTQLTERVTTDATGSTFVDYLTEDDRLVVYVHVGPGAQDSWLATGATSCQNVR